MSANVDKVNTFLKKGSSALLILMVFTLPINMFLNNLFLSIFLGLFGIYIIINFNKDHFLLIKQHFKTLIVLSIPVFILLFGMFYSPETKQALKEFGRLIPILIFVLFLLIQKSFFQSLIKQMLYALVLGCVISASFCWIASIIDVYQNNHSIFALFSREYANHNLSERIGIHTPYLALFVNASIGFCVYSIYDKSRLISKKRLVLIIIFLSIFLFNLMARNALLCFILFGILFLIWSKKHILLISFLGIITLLSVFTFTTEKNYLRDRFFKSINVFENETIFSKKDRRIDRIKASYEVFKQFPLIGPGAANEDKLRREQYYINRDSEAFNENYNSHNQFMEYLSTYGILGGISFLILFFTLFKIVFEKKSYFLLFLVSCFFIANLTESVLERTWGIVYYILMITVLLSWDIKMNIKIQKNV
jgi:O-antigen ligase